MVNRFMTNLRELITNLIIFFLLIYCLMQSFLPIFGYTFFLPFNFVELGDESFDYSRLLLLKSASLFTMGLFIVNYSRHKRPLSAIAPLVVMSYSLVFFEILFYFTVAKTTNYSVSPGLIVFFTLTAGLLHYRNIKDSKTIFKN